MIEGGGYQNKYSFGVGYMMFIGGWQEKDSWMIFFYFLKL